MASPLRKRRRVAVHVALAQRASGCRPLTLKAVLGSSVGVFLWDPRSGVGGLAHVLLPGACLRAGPGKSAATALPLLVDDLAGLGAARDRLIAKVAGGADVVRVEGMKALGASVVHSVREVLEALEIPVRGEECGGRRGRIVLADLEDGTLRISEFRGGTSVL